MASTQNAVENIQLINLLCRLGVSYHFEVEIREQLARLNEDLPALLAENDYDLYTTALLFRVLRQHAHKIPCDVFSKFKDNNGTFKEGISNDLKGILCLYEASHLSVRGEEILDEALEFTKAKLESLATQSSPHLAQHIQSTLARPLHRDIQRIKHREYISFYEKDEACNETLLRFAKVDFNRVQLLHRQELSHCSNWWKESNLAEELHFARDRIAEIYFWSVGAHFEPEYALSRILITEYIMLTSLIDDVYDSYGTIEELRSFTSAFERCNMDAMDQVTDYLKVLFKALVNLFDETEDAMAKVGRSFSAYYTKKEYIDVVKAYHQEAEWFSARYVPSFDEYMSAGLVTSAYCLIPAVSFIGMEKYAGVNEYKWLLGDPKIIIAAKTLSRLIDDVMTHEYEQKRGHCPSSVECYMKEHNVSEEEAVGVLQKKCENAWKDLNDECMSVDVVPAPLLYTIRNIVRVLTVVYEHDDGYSNSIALKHHISSLFLEPVPL